MAQEAKTADGKAYALGGASRSGKTAMAMIAVKRVAPMLDGGLVWDIEDQWSKIKGFRRVTSAAELWALRNNWRGEKIAFVADFDIKRAFAIFCAVAFYLAKDKGKKIFIVSEELADVTSSGKAPDDWGNITRRVLKRGCWVFSISQRWAEADKTAINNSTEIVMFGCSKMDADYMAKRYGVPVAELMVLEVPEDCPDKPFLRFTKSGKILARETLKTKTGKIVERNMPAA